MFLFGVLLILAEVLVIPGFGVAGIAGLMACITSLVLMMLGNDYFDFTFVSNDALVKALMVVFVALMGTFILLFVGGAGIIKSRFFKRIALEDTLDKSKGYTSNFKEKSYLGEQGVVHSPLRPAGNILIGDELFQATSRGEFLEKGTQVVVINEENTTLRVKRLEE